MSFDWKSAVAAVAPTLGTAFGGPLGGLAMAALSKKLLGKGDGTEAEIAAAVQAGGPEVLTKLRELDQAFAVKMRELDINLEKLHQDDRASARQANVSGGIQGRVFILVLVIFIVVLGIEGAVLFVGIPPTVDGQVAGRVLGTLDACLLAALYYIFGSSAGSQSKDAVISRVVR